MARPSLAWCLLAVGLLAGCGTTEPASRSGSVVIDTVGGIGVAPSLPEGVSTIDVAGLAVPTAEEPVGRRTDGNRVLMIGDSIFAGSSSRYGDEACTALVPLGWQVAVEAEVGRFIEFGQQVVDDRLEEGWDAAVIMLGSNYNGDEVGYEETLGHLLDVLEPRPVIVLTVSSFRPIQDEVNTAIARQVLAHDTVEVYDWRTVSMEEGMLFGDDIHPTSLGRRTMMEGIAALLGSAPTGPGACLPATFVEDEVVPGAPGGPGGQTSVPSGTDAPIVVTPSSTTAAVPEPVTTTTVATPEPTTTQPTDSLAPVP